MTHRQYFSWPILLVAAFFACTEVNTIGNDPAGNPPETPCAIGTVGCFCTKGGACDPELACSPDNVCVETQEGTESPIEEDGGPLLPFVEADFGDFPDCYQGCGVSYTDTPLDVEITGVGGESAFSINGKRYSSIQGTIDDDLHQQVWGYD